GHLLAGVRDGVGARAPDVEAGRGDGDRNDDRARRPQATAGTKSTGIDAVDRLHPLFSSLAPYGTDSPQHAPDTTCRWLIKRGSATSRRLARGLLRCSNHVAADTGTDAAGTSLYRRPEAIS